MSHQLHDSEVRSRTEAFIQICLKLQRSTTSRSKSEDERGVLIDSDQAPREVLYRFDDAEIPANSTEYSVLYH